MKFNFFRNPKNAPFVISPKSPLFQEITQSKKFQDRSKLLDKWKPRRMCVSEGVEKTGLPQIYLEGSPEQQLGEFLFNWKNQDYLTMAEILMPLTIEKSFSKFTKEMTTTFEELKLKRFHFIDIEDEGPSQTKITVAIELLVNGKKRKQNMDINLKFLSEEGRPSVFGVEEGTWTFDWTELHPIFFH